MSPDGTGYQSTDPSLPQSGYSEAALALLIVHPESLSGLRIALTPGLILGRAPEPSVASIFHPTISRHHAEVRAGGAGGLCLVDLSSRNGSSVNGVRATSPEPLAPQSLVRLGDVLGVVDYSADGAFDADPVLPGTSLRILQARAELARAAPDRAPVLITGETGTGKERVARDIHRRSERSGPYLALNCAELSPQLVESELFGHERGAFTGAASAKAGLFAAADGGTLFLDEIGELNLELQAKLLRAIQEGEVRPVGGTRTVPVNVRVVAATNRDLPALVAHNLFRRDLYARLALWEIHLPPLRERRQDILPWSERLLRLWNFERSANAHFSLLPDAAERVLLHPWLDNLRGLDRLVHRLGSLGLDRPFSLRALIDSLPELGAGSTPPPAGASSSPPAADGQRSTATPDGRERPSREAFLSAYERCGRSVRATSKHFGRDRRQIYRWLEAFGIAREAGERD